MVKYTTRWVFLTLRHGCPHTGYMRISCLCLDIVYFLHIRINKTTACWLAAGEVNIKAGFTSKKFSTCPLPTRVLQNTEKSLSKSPPNSTIPQTGGKISPVFILSTGWRKPGWWRPSIQEENSRTPPAHAHGLRVRSKSEAQSVVGVVIWVFVQTEVGQDGEDSGWRCSDRLVLLCAGGLWDSCSRLRPGVPAPVRLSARALHWL